MAGMDGVEATRHIRALDGGAAVKIVALTASGFDARRSEVLAAGLDDYLHKPFRPAEVFDCMARHLGVRYRRAGVPAKAEPEPRPSLFSAEAVAALPPELRAELQDAIVALDASRIETVVKRVSEVDARLGEAMAECARTFSYSVLLRALESVRRPV